MKVFGIPIRTEASFFAMTLFLGMGRNLDPVFLAEWAIIVFISILVHELGHGLAGCCFGLSPEIRLYAMGGATYFPGGKEIQPFRHIIISLAGPFSGFLFGGITLLLRSIFDPHTVLLRTLFADLLWVNFGWGLFNLLPMLPLDGGNVMKSVEEWITGRKKGNASHIISLMVASCLCIWALMERSIWIAFLTALFIQSNGSVLFNALQTRLDRTRQSSLDKAWDMLRKGEGTAAAVLAQDILASARSKKTKMESLQLLIHGFIEEKNFEKAGRELRRYEACFGKSTYLESCLLIGKGEIAQAISALSTEFESRKSEHTGEMLAHALIDANRLNEALEVCSDPVMEASAGAVYQRIQDKAFHTSSYQTSAAAGRLAFERGRDPAVAYNIGCALARDGQVDESLEWIARAVDAGFEDKALISSDPDIDVLRSLPEFDLIFEKLSK